MTIYLSREDAATLFDLVKEQGLNSTKVVVNGPEAFVAARKKDRVRTADRKADVGLAYYSAAVTQQRVG